MMKRPPVKFFATTLLSAVLVIASGCAQTQDKGGSGGASKASPEATAAITAAGEAIAAAKANDWIWRDTEKFLKQAKAAADKGDNETAVKLANKAKSQAESAVTQFNHEKNNPRGI